MATGQRHFLDLPNEIIVHILSYLDIKSRLRARVVNKRLREIEAAEYKYAKKLVILELPMDASQLQYLHSRYGQFDHNINLRKDTPYALRSFEKIAEKVYIGRLVIQGEHGMRMNKMMLTLMNGCRHIDVLYAEHIRPRTIVDVHWNLKYRSNVCRSIRLYKLPKATFYTLLSHVGIKQYRRRFRTYKFITAYRKHRSMRGGRVPTRYVFFDGPIMIHPSEELLIFPCATIDVCIAFFDSATREQMERHLVSKGFAEVNIRRP